jgi:peptide deformylase
LIAKMKKALEGEKYGVALAAPQLGSPLRLFVIAGRVFLPEDAPEDMVAPPHLVFINPELVRTSRKKAEMSEGCLSVRGKYGSVMRFERATVKALDETGRPFVRNGSGLLAQIFQHELDHLEGILFIDKAIKLDDWKEKAE